MLFLVVYGESYVRKYSSHDLQLSTRQTFYKFYPFLLQKYKRCLYILRNGCTLEHMDPIIVSYNSLHWAKTPTIKGRVSGKRVDALGI